MTGPTDAGLCFFGRGDESTEAEVRHDRRLRRVVITRRFALLSGQQPGRVAFGSGRRSTESFEQAFDDGNE